MHTLPYFNEKLNTHFPRLVVKPVKIPASVTDSGLLNPEHAAKFCEMGEVVSTCIDSTFNVGDTVSYNKIDRTDVDFLDEIEVDGENCDIVFEREIYEVNDRPVNRIYVRPISELEMSETGLILPASVTGITQKGIVFDAPDGYSMKKGDRIEYAKLDAGGIYAQAVVDGIVLDVIGEMDIFTVNGEVAPYRMIIKIDLAAQHVKRTTSDSGLSLSPLFIAMLHNLQYAQVMGVGSEAQKMYPEVSAHDTVIIHHSIENTDYRVIGHEYGKHGGATFQYRVINCWQEKSREIFGKLHYERNTGKIIDITPVNGSVFLAWEFDILSGHQSESALLASGSDLPQYRNIDDLRNMIEHKKKNAAEKAKLKLNGIMLHRSQFNPELQPAEWSAITKEMELIKKEETAVAQYLRKDHMVVAKTVYPRSIPAYVITPYEELYPINILGKKFLIAAPEFIISKSHTNMHIKLQDIVPMNNMVWVRPLDESTSGDLLIPDSAKERPVKGIVAAVEEDGRLSKDAVVLFRRGAGFSEDIEGVPYLILHKNDLIAVVG